MYRGQWWLRTREGCRAACKSDEWFTCGTVYVISGIAIRALEMVSGRGIVQDALA